MGPGCSPRSAARRRKDAEDGAPKGATWGRKARVLNDCALSRRAVPLPFRREENLESLGRIRAARTMERDRMDAMSAQAAKDSNADLTGRDA